MASSGSRLPPPSSRRRLPKSRTSGRPLPATVIAECESVPFPPRVQRAKRSRIVRSADTPAAPRLLIGPYTRRPSAGLHWLGTHPILAINLLDRSSLPVATLYFAYKADRLKPQFGNAYAPGYDLKASR